MVRQGKFSANTRISISYSKVRDARDLDALAYILIPDKRGIEKREALFRIFKAIRDAPNQRIRSLDHFAGEGLAKSTLWKMRKEMRAASLINFRAGEWFFSNLTALMRRVSGLMEPATEERQAKYEFIARTRRSRADWTRLLGEKATDWRRFWGGWIGSSHPS